LAYGRLNIHTNIGIGPQAVLSDVYKEIEKLPKVSGSGAGQVYLAPDLARAFDAAEKAAEKSNDSFVTVERLLLGLALTKDSEAGSILRKGNVTPQNLNAAIESLRKGRTADSATAENAYDALKKYARDLTQAAREGKRLQEEVRVAGTKGRPARWLRLRVRPLGERGPDRRLTVWSLSDVTRERERQENVFQELQHAVDYLDHAPAGFFSVDAKGDVVYLNATLANWLDQDLAQVGSGGLKLADLVAGDGAAVTSSHPPPTAG